MAKNFYAIKYGINPDTGDKVTNLILKTWEETEPYIKGVKGAKFSGFNKKEEAEEYLKAGDPLLRKKDGNYPEDCLHCYIDGSYRSNNPNYSYSLVCVENGKIVYFEGGPGSNSEAISMQQVGGELLGAIKAVLYAKQNKHKKVVIFHDYKGTCYHATGYWKRDSDFSKIYYDWMQNFFKDNPELEVIFCKVDAHAGDDFNEIADGIAKISLGLKPESKFRKLAEIYNMPLDAIYLRTEKGNK